MAPPLAKWRVQRLLLANDDEMGMWCSHEVATESEMLHPALTGGISSILMPRQQNTFLCDDQEMPCAAVAEAARQLRSRLVVVHRPRSGW